MYISKIKINQGPAIFEYLNTHKRSNLYADHQLLWSLFPEDPDVNRDFLFRKEIKNNSPVYYVVSKRVPASSSALFCIETKEFKPQIRCGQKFSFTLRVNPVITKKFDGGDKSKRHNIWMNAWREGKSKGLNLHDLSEYIDKQTKNWLNERSKDWGFTVDVDELIVEGYTQHRLNGGKLNKNIQISSLDYYGILEIIDEKLMLNALLNGIGKAKAFGCGLLLIKRL
jgi:CRISPR system Cascade subunit CasE